jgi:hypothetical protein
LRRNSRQIVLGDLAKALAIDRALLPLSFIAMIEPRSSAFKCSHHVFMPQFPFQGKVLHFNLETAW